MKGRDGRREGRNKECHTHITQYVYMYSHYSIPYGIVETKQ